MFPEFTSHFLECHCLLQVFKVLGDKTFLCEVNKGDLVFKKNVLLLTVPRFRCTPHF